MRIKHFEFLLKLFPKKNARRKLGIGRGSEEKDVGDRNKGKKIGSFLFRANFSKVNKQQINIFFKFILVTAARDLSPKVPSNSQSGEKSSLTCQKSNKKMVDIQ